MKMTFIFSIIGALLMIMLPQSTLAARTISFGGYNWNVKNGYYAPGPNYWSDAADQVYIDDNGALHLSVKKRADGKWYASEVWLPQSLGYGTYEFEFASRLDHIDTNLVAAPFLYQDDRHEFDIEYTNWKTPGDANVWYTAQPETTAASSKNFYFTQANGPVIGRIVWSPNGITFTTVQNNIELAKWIYVGINNFTPGNERVHINFWMTDGSAPSDKQNKEIVINRFEFTPLIAATPTTQTTIDSVSSLPAALTPVSKDIKRKNKPLPIFKQRGWLKR